MYYQTHQQYSFKTEIQHLLAQILERISEHVYTCGIEHFRTLEVHNFLVINLSCLADYHH